LTRLRAAAAAVADLDAADHAPDHAPDHTPDGRPDDGPDGAAAFDATDHADRFSELHDALESVLADVDRG
jgi:hypothetical protein